MQQKYPNAFFRTFIHSSIFYHATLLTIAICFMLYISPIGFHIFILSLCFREISIHFQQCRIRNSSKSFISIHPLNFLFQKHGSFFLSASISPFFSLSLWFSLFPIFLLICRDKAIRRVNIPPRKIQPQTTLESHRFVASTCFLKESTIFGLTKFFFFTSFYSALAVLCVWL